MNKQIILVVEYVQETRAPRLSALTNSLIIESIFFNRYPSMQGNKVIMVWKN